MNVAVVCFEFRAANLRKQPWRYVHELISGLSTSGADLTMVTNVDQTEVAGISVESVEQLYGARGPTSELIDTIERVAPDVVVSLIGPTTFFRSSTLASETTPPTIGLFAGPRHRLTEVLNVGLTELYRNHEYIAVHLLGSLVPDMLLRQGAAAFDHIVTLTPENERRLRTAGINTSISTVQPGIDEFDFEKPRKTQVAAVRSELNVDDTPLILYFTSPLTLRGTDILVEAFAAVRRKVPCKLVVLARQDNGGLSDDEVRLQRLAADRNVADSFELLPKDLSPEGVKTYLAAADVVALPYKLVQSSVPISILETMAVGTPLISTRSGGIPELIGDDLQLVEPGDRDTLTATLYSFVSDPDLRERVGKRNREWMETYQRWDDARDEFRTIVANQ